jgi:tetratricopeptide (TPR) repeat protein
MSELMEKRRRIDELESEGMAAWVERGDTAEAERKLKEALSEARELARVTSPLAQICNNLAALYTDSNRFDEAETLYKQALSLLELLDPNDLFMINLLDGYAKLLDKVGRTQEAESHRSRATAINEDFMKERMRESTGAGGAPNT